jgi:hypothetical protein
MKIIFRGALLAIIAALGCWLWTIIFPSPEKAVLKQISRLAACATFTANAGSLTRANQAGNLVSCFSLDAEISVDVAGYPPHTLSGREEIREAALGAFTRLATLKVQFLDASVRLGADKLTADVSCTARISIGDNKDFGVQEMHFQLKKLDGDWLITKAETVKTLSRKIAPQLFCRHTSRKPSSVKSGATAEISGSFAAINFA